MASCLGVGVSLFGVSVQRSRNSWGVRVRSEGGASADSVSAVVNGASVVGEKEGSWSSIDKGNGWLKSKSSEKKIKLRDDVPQKLEPFWDDGYGTVTVKDYFAAAKDFTQHPDGGPPRWFCPVASGSPLKGSPILLFLPGMDGTGCGLIMHHKALGKAFEVRCLHIPVQDRTPFEGLVKLVEETIRSEHACSPNKPIYLVGDSFGGCLALAVASRNPKMDLVLILANPGAMPDVLHETVPYVLSFVMGEPLKMATVDVESKLPPMQQFEKVSQNLTALLPYLSDLASIIPKDTLLWKLKLLKSAAAYANSRLHAVNAEVLVLASGKDNMVPSGDEAQRLRKSLQNCTVRYFKENGHTLLLEDGIGLMTVIKSTYKYRRSRKHDAVTDYLPPSLAEYNYAFTQVTGLFHFLTGSTMFSTLGDGTIVKGLSGVPNEGPVLLVGYHNLLGLELTPLVEGFLREKSIVVRGIAHPELFLGKLESESPEFSMIDWVKVFGAVPVTANNLYKLLSEKAHVLLYPGGAREALHYKGEEYKLFWPNQQEFVRMAARFGATIVPFGAVGEDDIAQLTLDYNDLMKIPVVSDYIREANQNSARVRDVDSGEVGNQNLFPPLLLPKIPGRFYYLFGKPIVTKGREEILKDKNSANQLYNQVKSEVEHSLAYLIKKRKEDPYRNFVDRTVYKAIYSSQHEVPAFDP
ncbi:acyltransferase-like protein At1g54570, chloroplastic isoform X2 [Benincasa hispida]|uniref:acyltransferase-like protein At1g54570, chloroplastic isoform X2 n=1 Tax=Benincasa hispida TaxID=102211 RepID=UPI00190182DC|nr:acyltransferase-like protein At1g54570, chloroplastic isoform X2 [Benincasa hispida]